MNHTPISAIVLTKNEAFHLADCLATLKWADELLVVDSFSTDSTIEIARSAGARVIQHAFVDYAAQRNFAQEQAQYDWVLFIDADERLGPGLAEEILTVAQSDKFDQCHAYYIGRLELFSGRWLHIDPAHYRVTPEVKKGLLNSKFLRFYNRRFGHWERPLHEYVVIPEPYDFLNGAILHYSTTNLHLVVESFNSYTDREAAYLHKNYAQMSLLRALWRGLRSGLYQYLIAGYWRYGEQGFLLSIWIGIIKFMNYAKLHERIRIENNVGVWSERDRQLLENIGSAKREKGT